MSLEGCYRIEPALGPSLRWAAPLVLWLSVALAALIAADHWWGDRSPPSHWRDSLLEVILVLPIMVIALGSVVFLIGRAFAATATREGLRGPAFWRKAVVLPWASIESVQARSFHGLPGLRVKSTTSKQMIVIFTAGLDEDEAFARLAELAGAEHILTRCFAGART